VLKNEKKERLGSFSASSAGYHTGYTLARIGTITPKAMRHEASDAIKVNGPLILSHQPSRFKRDIVVHVA
jgi:hypothetical protein